MSLKIERLKKVVKILIMFLVLTFFKWFLFWMRKWFLVLEVLS